ncbi:SNF2-related protein [Aquabacterium sp.]|uniref:SNF2-related protein n=1 Tax=Aquabacterium sp. TaxID=1872578 RepID=UPI0037835F93
MATTARSPRKTSRQAAAEAKPETPAPAVKTPAAAKKAVARKAAPAQPAPGAKQTASAKQAAAPKAAPAAKKALARKTADKVTKKPAPQAAAKAAQPPAEEPAEASAPAAEVPKTVPSKRAAAKKASAPTKTPAAKKAPAARKAAAKQAAAQQAPAKKTPARKTASRARPAPAAEPLLDDLPATPAAASAPAPAPTPQPDLPPHSALALVCVDQRHQIVWRPGRHCPPALAAAAAARLDAQGCFAPDDDGLLPQLLALAAATGHRLEVPAAVWLQFAANRDARHRLQALEAAYPGGPGDAALQSLLRCRLPSFQAEGALFAVVAGRALIADERGLGKRVQAMAAITLWRRHFGLRRVLVLCTPAQRTAWQRAWARWSTDAAAAPAQIVEGPLHQRQALWSGEAELRILSPEALDSDAAHIARWQPELVVVDEPQQLPGWRHLQAPQALVLCGAPLAEPPTLLHEIVDWLDPLRQGALQAVERIQAARAGTLVLTDEVLEQLDAALSRVMLQRLRSEVTEQLPPRVHTERLVPLAPPQREAHDQLRTEIDRLLAGWQRSGYLADADQWRLRDRLAALTDTCHRHDASDARSALAEATIAALQAQLDDWAATGTERIALVCPQAADRPLLAERLRGAERLHWLAPGEAPPPAIEVVLQVGVPWQAPDGEASAPGQQWVYLTAEGSLELGLFETLAARQHLPATGPGFLHGRTLNDWLQACAQACAAAG